MRNDEQGLDDLFQNYRASCSAPEPSVHFMPNLWLKIEARRSFWQDFQHFARAGMAVSLALALVLFFLFTAASDRRPVAPTYADALAADHTAETTYYAEAIRIEPVSDRSATPIIDGSPR